MAGVIFQSYLHFWLEFVKIGIFETNLAIKEVTIFVQSCLFCFRSLHVDYVQLRGRGVSVTHIETLKLPNLFQIYQIETANLDKF